MRKYTKKPCPNCCPGTGCSTTRYERGLAGDGSAIWRCTNCSNEVPRRERRSKQQVLDAEACEALGLDADDDSLDALLAIIDYGQRKAAGVNS